ncbi:hypothetical protein SUGI_1096970 [Cryptomeria japonica]|nr:hypothetical protein SUGI_1096970 [Cryptomeria japonica]
MENILDAYFNTFHWTMWISLVIAVVLRLFPLNINRRGNNLPNEKADKEKKVHMEEDTDEDLQRRAKAGEEQAALLSQDLESMNQTRSQSKDENLEFLWEKMRQVCEENRNIALMVSSQVQSRKRERSFASDTLRLIQGEMERRTKVLENEKNALQKTLEKEIDRRSIEWASMLEKFQFEERRMRKRMRDLQSKM